MRLYDGNMDRQIADLRGLLSTMPGDAVLEFDRVLDDVFARAYRWDLCGAAHVIGSGCSDDSFGDFRCWLISMGRRVYEDALADPESLAAASAAPGVEDVFFEEFGYVAETILDERGASPEADARAATLAEPSGERWTPEALPGRFPRLWSAYGAK